MPEPKHRKNVLVRTSPRIQEAPRHAADRMLERLGAEAPQIRDLFADLASNPFQGRAR